MKLWFFWMNIFFRFATMYNFIDDGWKFGFCSRSGKKKRIWYVITFWRLKRSLFFHCCALLLLSWACERVLFRMVNYGVSVIQPKLSHMISVCLKKTERMKKKHKKFEEHYKHTKIHSEYTQAQTDMSNVCTCIYLDWETVTHTNRYW